MYTFESRIRYSEIGEDKKLTLTGLLNYFQDCTTFHSDALHRGMDVLETIHRAWVLTSWQVCVNRYPCMGENVRISTWPYDFKGFCGARNFKMTSQEGEILAYANSMWAFIDTQTGMPARMEEEELLAYVKEEKLDMDYAPRKIIFPGEGREKEKFTVKQHHLDTNHHVNNVQYVRLAQDYIPQALSVCQMRAEYKKQATLGDVMVPVAAAADGVYTVALRDETGVPYAVVEFK